MRAPSLGSAMLATLALTLAAACAAPGASEQPPDAAAGPATPLENTHWRLLDLEGQPARTADDGTGPDLRLDPAEHQASGNTGCNGYSGPYELSGGSLRFGALVSTRRACAAEEMNRQEAAFVAALRDTRTWRITGDTLVLSGETEQLARFVARPGPAGAD